ncbi:MAG: hypothetical protein EXR54_07155 [Dehalococcoidia bacterium]|nr:hypothetical protein [Dehalococcoidia bacterium]MSQ17328.1 hypothetical protein [Dehalococcoidia bacterium]
MAEITGDGRYALLAPCPPLTVTLWRAREEAAEAKQRLDQAGCGGQCNPRLHHIVDLTEASQLFLLPQR